MKAQSRKDALARTVKLLTRQGTNVTFRGSTPFVAADMHTGEIVRLNLPEIPDEAPQLLVDALQGYLDHEVGHIFYTPFIDVPDRRKDPKAGVFANIFEDIRLEKLLPRDLPGTKDNLERMYVNWLPLIVQPGLDAVEAEGDRDRMISALLMPMCRALGGQKVFQQLMDDKGYWAIVEPLMKRLPGFGAQVSAMETYADVLACVERLKDALTPPPPPPAPPIPDPSQEDDSNESQGDDADDGEPAGDSDDAGGDADQQSGDDEDEADNDKSRDEQASPDDGEDQGDGERAGGDDADDDASDGDAESDEDDGEPSDADGDGEPDPDADRASGPGDGSDHEPGDDDGDDDGDGDSEDAADDSDGGEGGKRNRTMQEALGMLDPTLRRALYLHKRRNKSVSDIAGEMNVSDQRVEEMLREARRGLADLMRK